MTNAFALKIASCTIPQLPKQFHRFVYLSLLVSISTDGFVSIDIRCVDYMERSIDLITEYKLFNKIELNLQLKKRSVFERQLIDHFDIIVVNPFDISLYKC